MIRIAKTNIRNGYRPQKRIRTYLGTYANRINVANPQFGEVFYLKQFGVKNNNSPDEFFYSVSGLLLYIWLKNR